MQISRLYLIVSLAVISVVFFTAVMIFPRLDDMMTWSSNDLLVADCVAAPTVVSFFVKMFHTIDFAMPNCFDNGSDCFLA